MFMDIKTPNRLLVSLLLALFLGSVVAAAPVITVQYYSDLGLTSPMGNNPYLKAGTYYLQINSSDPLNSTPTVSIVAQGTANDLSSSPTIAVGGSETSFVLSRTVTADPLALGSAAENITVYGNDSGVIFSNLSPSNDGTAAAYIDTQTPALSAVNISSSSSNHSLASFGDVVTLGFTSSEPLASPNVTIDGHAATVANVGDVYSASYTMAANDTAGAVAFNIAYSDLAGNMGIAVSVTSDSSSVTFVPPPVLSTVSITSSNTNHAIAIVGDTITLSFTSSEPISTPNVTIDGHPAAVSGSGSSYTATYNMGNSDVKGPVSFVISFANLAGYGGTAVSNTTDSSSIAYDAAPALSSVIIYSNNTKSGLAKIGDIITLEITAPEAISTPAVTIEGHSANVSGSGSSYTANYSTSATDPAGNVSFSIVYADLSGISAPAVSSTTDGSLVIFYNSSPILTYVHLSSSDSNSGTARIGDEITLAITSNETIQVPQVSILGHPATVSGSGSSYTATYAPNGADAAGLVPICIAFADAAGNNGTIVTATTDSSSINFDSTPIVASIHISSSNSNPSAAGPGDSIALSFDLSQVIGSPYAVIDNHPASITSNGNQYTASYLLNSTNPAGKVTFMLAYTDASGNRQTIVSTTDGSSVTFYNSTPTLTSVQISSSNANHSQASAGDTVTLAITSSGPIKTPIVTIDGHPATVSGSGSSYSAQYTLASSDPLGNLTFSVVYSNPAGNSGPTILSTTDASSIMVSPPPVKNTGDNSSPTISNPNPLANNSTVTTQNSGDVLGSLGPVLLGGLAIVVVFGGAAYLMMSGKKGHSGL